MGRLHIAVGAMLVATVTTVGAGSPTGSTFLERPERASAPAAVEPVPSLRPTHALARRLLDDGVGRSSTFRRFVDRLERSDVIVYVEVRPDLRDSLGGIMRFVGTTETHRLVRITINGRHNWPTMVALLGHELQHAVEIAEAPHVDSEKTMRRYYQRAGIQIAQDTFDSVAAQRAGRIVRAEFGRGESDTEPRLARARAAQEERLLAGGSIGGEMMP
jgi:hypothetical protein